MPKEFNLDVPTRSTLQDFLDVADDLLKGRDGDNNKTVSHRMSGNGRNNPNASAWPLRPPPYKISQVGGVIICLYACHNRIRFTRTMAAADPKQTDATTVCEVRPDPGSRQSIATINSSQKAEKRNIKSTLILRHVRLHVTTPNHPGCPVCWPSGDSTTWF